MACGVKTGDKLSLTSGTRRARESSQTGRATPPRKDKHTNMRRVTVECGNRVVTPPPVIGEAVSQHRESLREQCGFDLMFGQTSAIAALYRFAAYFRKVSFARCLVSMSEGLARPDTLTILMTLRSTSS